MTETPLAETALGRRPGRVARRRQRALRGRRRHLDVPADGSGAAQRYIARRLARGGALAGRASRLRCERQACSVWRIGRPWKARSRACGGIGGAWRAPDTPRRPPRAASRSKTVPPSSSASRRPGGKLGAGCSVGCSGRRRGARAWSHLRRTGRRLGFATARRRACGA